MAMLQNTKVDPQERARLFAQSTRQNFHPISIKAGAEGTIVSFDVPKTRLLAGLVLNLSAVLTATHASITSYTPHEDSPWKFIKRVEVSLNNGFSPFSITGQSLYIYNVINRGAGNMALKTSGRGSNVQPLVSSVGGTANAVNILAKLPIAVNPRDAIGLILAQNDETLVTVNVTLGTKDDIAPALGGFTFALSAISVALHEETFSIPAAPEAFPDLSVLKLVNEKTESIIAGENTIKLPVGQIYRKLWLIVYNATPTRVNDSGITSNFDIVFNGADIPYRYEPKVVGSLNSEWYDGDLPNGVYVFDWSAQQGLPNLSGARDYVDTERVTDLYIKFTAAAAGSIRIGYETLSRLKMG